MSVIRAKALPLRPFSTSQRLGYAAAGRRKLAACALVAGRPRKAAALLLEAERLAEKSDQVRAVELAAVLAEVDGSVH